MIQSDLCKSDVTVGDYVYCTQPNKSEYLPPALTAVKDKKLDEPYGFLVLEGNGKHNSLDEVCPSTNSPPAVTTTSSIYPELPSLPPNSLAANHNMPCTNPSTKQLTKQALTVSLTSLPTTQHIKHHFQP